MAREACTNALQDCGLSYTGDIDVVVASYCYGEPTSGMYIMSIILYCCNNITEYVLKSAIKSFICFMT